MLIVRAELQSLKYLWDHPTVMALVGIPDYCTKRGPVGWASRFRFLDQIAQGLLADHWKDDIEHDAIRSLQSGAGDPEQQILLACDALQIIKQFTVNPVFGPCTDVMDSFDEQIDQVIGQRSAAQMDERRKPTEPGRLWVPGEFVGGLCGDAPSIPIELMG